MASCFRFAIYRIVLIHSFVGALFCANAPFAQAQSTGPQALVREVQHETLGDRIRVLITLDRPIQFVEGTATDPYRIFFDLQGTRPAGTLMSKMPVGDPILRRIRVAQYQPGITRVVLDVGRPAPYTALLLSNPSRLLVEISRAATLAQTRAVAALPAAAMVPINSEAVSVKPQLDEGKTAIAMSMPSNIPAPRVRTEMPSSSGAPLDTKLVSHAEPRAYADPAALLRAARAGNPTAQFELANLYAAGRGVERDPGAAATWYRAAALQGNTVAASNLGVLYANGTGVPQNDAEAVNWFRKAAEAGYAGGKSNLGSMYIAGRGLPQSDALGAKWVLPAAQEGIPEAQYALGTLYANGRGVPQDEAQAVRWFKAAATQGYVPAQVLLGKIYSAGSGVPRDYSEAYSWFALAAASGDREGLSGMNSLAPRLTADQLAQAQLRALVLAQSRR